MYFVFVGAYRIRPIITPVSVSPQTRVLVKIQTPAQEPWRRKNCNTTAKRSFKNRFKLSQHRFNLSKQLTKVSILFTNLQIELTKVSEHRFNLSKALTKVSEHRFNLSKQLTKLSMVSLNL